MEKYTLDDVQRLKKRYEKLNQEKMRTEVELDSTQKELEHHLSSAKEQFGVDNLDDLKALYMQRVEENNSNIDTFSRTLDEIEEQLAKLG